MLKSFRFGIQPVNVGIDDPAQMVAIAQHAEAVGVESIWTFEHVIVPVDYASKYPYSRSGKMPATPETSFHDPLITLSYIAAATTTLRLGTGVNILPQANPLFFAKQVATLDALSGGRTLMGVGAGWLREEFDAMGVPFARRGARFDDYLQAIRKVWSGETVEHKSDFLDWSGFKCHPLPAQRPGPPLIIGGVSEPAMRRAARLGDGWFALSRNIEQLTAMVGRFRQVCEENDRDPASVEISTSWLPEYEGGFETWEAYRDAGVTRLIAPLTQLGGATPMEGLDLMAAALG
jgi:probable F420-dependent oxidoreductase